jgi:fumarylacetoacetate (FAA) hydrolase
MKLVSYLESGKDALAIYHDGMVYPLDKINGSLPNNMMDYLNGGDATFEQVNAVNEQVLAGELEGIEAGRVELLAPVPNPPSCRDAYAFRQHVAAARRNRGVDMISEFDQYPIFYFTNHNAITGEGPVELMPDHFEKLDFELEVAAVIGKKGRNIKAADADQYIAGYTIMNDWSARRLQMEEMKLNLGPAKGKDFATSIGPWFVTVDELEQYKTAAKDGHEGDSYDLEMVCTVNGEELSRGNMKDMDWTFAEIVERCSYGVDVFPGDVIGSGTVGTGCLLELNGTGLLNDPDYAVQWLKDGDEVTMTMTGLGTLTNQVKAVPTDHSLLALKKNIEVNS